MDLYIGIDLGKEKHIAAFLSADLLARHKRFRSCPTLLVPNSSAGFEQLLATIEKYSTSAETCVLVEHTGHYGFALIQYLQEHSVTIFHMQVHVRHSWDKTDEKDAQALGNLLYNTVAMGIQSSDKTQRIARLEPLPDVVHRLRGLVRHRFELVQESTRRKNKLTAICDQLFPELTQVYKDPNKISALNLREKFPTPRDVAQASLDILCATRARTVPSREKPGLLQRLAAESIGTHDDARRFSLTLEQRQLIAELRLIQKHIAELEGEIETLTINSREGQILLSFGIGKIQAGILVSSRENVILMRESASIKAPGRSSLVLLVMSSPRCGSCSGKTTISYKALSQGRSRQLRSSTAKRSTRSSRNQHRKRAR